MNLKRQAVAISSINKNIGLPEELLHDVVEGIVNVPADETFLPHFLDYKQGQKMSSSG